MDANDATIFEVFGLSGKFVEYMKDLKTPLLDQFINGLIMDDNGNVLYEKEDDDSSNTIMLNFSHRPTRRGTLDKIAEIKNEAISLKEKVIENLIWNTEDQNQKSTIIEYASAFDLHQKHEKATRIKFIKQLYLIYGIDYVHEVVDDAKADLTEFNISIKYPAKLKCNENELLAEFNSLWPTLTKSWLKFKDSKPPSTTIKRFWMHIISEHAIEYPNLCDLVLLLLAVSPGTGPVERSFSKLAKICYKDRGSMKAGTLENLYLLSTFGIKENDEDLFEKIKHFLQK